MNSVSQNSDYMDLVFTENYENLEPDKINKYDVFCLIVWKWVEDIVNYKFLSEGFSGGVSEKYPGYRSLVGWVITYHRKWLYRNPFYFSNDNFWKVVEEMEKYKYPIFRHSRLPPRKDGNINWEQTYKNYFKYFISPFDPQITQNLLFEYLQSQSQLKDMDIAEFGCGAGYLVEFLNNKKVKKLTCVDKEQAALDLCEEKGKDIENLSLENGDFGQIKINGKFDLIISVNSILPEEKSRDSVISIFRNIKNHLKEDGKFVVILPAFEAVKKLMYLWEQHYLQYFDGYVNKTKLVQRCVAAIKKQKKYDKDLYGYSDDGHIFQIYHTKQTIKNELLKVGLEIDGEFQKVCYPKAITKRYDYGDFSNQKDDDIFDWFVVAKFVR
jgi:SAM-dependent methyltransferase